jgi:hypothetical protein
LTHNFRATFQFGVAMVAAAIFGQVTLNETMTARYISPALRTRMYSVRFVVGFIGAAAAAPMVA